MNDVRIPRRTVIALSAILLTITVAIVVMALRADERGAFDNTFTNAELHWVPVDMRDSLGAAICGYRTVSGERRTISELVTQFASSGHSLSYTTAGTLVRTATTAFCPEVAQ